MKVRFWFEVICGSVVGLLVGAPALAWLVALAGIDLVAGVIHASIEGRLSKWELWRGVQRKALMFLALRAVDFASHAEGLPDVPAVAVIAGALGLHELLSILEHASAGGWLPGPLSAWLRHMQQGAVESK